ncbi:FAD:protein FMN transferase [Terrabacter terrigena]|uniref:FAD:protein FMN transferase n=1 Tax=Terrabacter terrigena TaxID=574718 RepID=A0ABW3MUB7_9MICO
MSGTAGSAQVDATPAPPRRAWVEQVMGMPVSIHLRGDGVDGPGPADAVEQAFGVLRQMDSVFSTYRDDSDLMRLRREQVQLAQCSPLVEEALRLGQEAEELTRGAFTTLLPTGEGDLAFDPTGLVKGWAVDRASRPLRRLRGLSFCINAGGDLLVGAHDDLPVAGPDAILWRVGIEDPRDRQRIASTLTLARGAVATSGTAARGAHLYDPVEGRLVGRPGSVTVTGPTLLWADIWATALFVGSEATREAFATSATDYLSTAL